MTWETAYEDLQQVFDDGNFGPPAEIWVANGTYWPSNQYRQDGESPDDRCVTYLIPGAVMIFGGFEGYTSPSQPGEQNRAERNPEANLTILSGDLAGDDDEQTFPVEDPDPNVPRRYDDNAYHVVTMPFSHIQDGVTRLSGFIIRGGYADTSSWGHSRGGGIKSDMSTIDPNQPEGARLNRLVLKYNYAGLGGGGMFLMSKGVSYQLANCDFHSNYAGGDGGGLLVTFSNANLVNCLFLGNHADPGYEGGAVSHPGGMPAPNRTTVMLDNCTFFANAAYSRGAVSADAYDENGPQTTIMNSIAWGNEPNQIGGSIEVVFSDIEGGWSGTGNIDDDPLFQDSGDGNLRLSPTSPALNTGHNSFVPGDFTDVDDTLGTAFPIPWDLDKGERILPIAGDVAPCRVDMGVYEDQCLCVGDIDADYDVDIQDLANLLSCFGLPAPCPDGCCLRDLDCGSDVDLQDLAYLLSNFGYLTCCRSYLQGGAFGGESQDSMSGSFDPLTEWLRSATPEEVLAWWEAGMPPIDGEDR
ncbi:MAG: hypothetical protein HZB38_10095 [Planctomycetes bacterium]|nr:hypothetical protein [Planctomycetota bacterium]